MEDTRFRSALLLLGHGVFVALGALALEHGILRATTGDSAFQVFQWISQPGWDIEAHRFSAVVPQAMVKLFVLFGADLCTLLHVASLGHVLVAYGVFVACAHLWKSTGAALGCALAAVMCTRLTFYSPVLEANYLLCFPFLVMGYATSHADRAWSAWRIGAALLLSLVALVVHPMGWMVMLFVAAWLYVAERTALKVCVVLGLVALAWPVFSRFAFPPTGYELNQYDKVARGLHRFSDFCSWESLNFLRLHTFEASTNYLPALLALLIAVIGWSVFRRPLVALLALAGASAFLLVFLITFHEGDSAIMMDRAVLPVATLISFGTAGVVVRIRASVWRSAALLFTAVLLFVKVRDVSFASRPFRSQLATTHGLIALAQEQAITRGIVECGSLREEGLDVTWAFPIEILLRSSVWGADHGCVLVCSDQLPNERDLRSGQVFVLFDWQVDKNGTGYFQESGSPYKRVIQP